MHVEAIVVVKNKIMTLLQSSWSIARQLCTPASAIIGQSAALATQLTQSYANISEAQRRSQPGASTSQPQPFKRITKRQFAKLQLQQSHPAFAAFNASSARVAQALPLNDDELVKQHATAPNLYHGVQDWHMDFARVLRRYNYSLPSLPGQVRAMHHACNVCMACTPHTQPNSSSSLQNARL